MSTDQAAALGERARVGSESRIRATRLEHALDWAAALAPSSLVVASSCCGMSLSQGGEPFEALGGGPPVVSARTADLLIVAGPITRRQVPALLRIYDRMVDPRWVIAWGACAISGGAYDNYATIAGLDRIIPVDLVVPGCPPAPVALRSALDQLRAHPTRSDRGAAAHVSTATTRSSRPSEWPILRPDPDDDSGKSLAKATPLDDPPPQRAHQDDATRSAGPAEGSA